MPPTSGAGGGAEAIRRKADIVTRLSLSGRCRHGARCGRAVLRRRGKGGTPLRPGARAQLASCVSAEKLGRLALASGGDLDLSGAFVNAVTGNPKPFGFLKGGLAFFTCSNHTALTRSLPIGIHHNRHPTRHSHVNQFSYSSIRFSIGEPY